MDSPTARYSFSLRRSARLRLLHFAGARVGFVQHAVEGLHHHREFFHRRIRRAQVGITPAHDAVRNGDQFLHGPVMVRRRPADRARATAMASSIIRPRMPR